MATKAKPGRVWLRRLLWGAGVLAVLAFAIQGGEYGTTDLLSQREARAQLEAELEVLRDTVATLRTTLKQVRSDDATLERIAREEHGLVKGEKELIYRVRTAPDAVSRDSVPPVR
ncbi:MAG: septum formation initiator family protein [Gemmatimonadaceae bacterium]|nr:septum formation initiator family protein [Gemmatimonadaceae bacterium]